MGIGVAKGDILLKTSQCMKTENVIGSLTGYSSTVKERREKARPRVREGEKEEGREGGGTR